MNVWRIGLGLALVASGARAGLATPVLGARGTCTDPALEPGQVRTLAIDLATDARAIGALGFTLRFDPALLTVAPEDVTAGDVATQAAVEIAARAGNTPGTIRVQVVPTLRAPVAALADGEVARVAVRVPEDVAAGCASVALDAVTFHDARAGLRIVGGATAGGIATVSCASRTGIGGVRCRIAAVGDLIERATDRQVKARTRKKIVKLAKRIVARLDAIEGAPAKKAARRLRAANKLAATLARTVDRAERRRTLEASLAARARGQITGAQSLLRAALTPEP